MIDRTANHSVGEPVAVIGYDEGEIHNSRAALLRTHAERLDHHHSLSARPAPQEVVFTNVRELVAWTSAARIRRAPLHVRLELPMMSPDKQASWARAIERSHNDCGCSAAAVALLALIVFVATYMFVVGFASSIVIVAIGTSLGGIAAGVSGKFVGQWWSRITLRRQAATLAAQYEQGIAVEPGE
jgi:hypothetical protein